MKQCDYEGLEAVKELKSRGGGKRRGVAGDAGGGCGGNGENKGDGKEKKQPNQKQTTHNLVESSRKNGGEQGGIKESTNEGTEKVENTTNKEMARKAGLQDREKETEYQTKGDGRGERSKGEAGNENNSGDPDIDQGWAWMVTLGCFILFLVFPSNQQVTAVLLMDLVDELDTSISNLTIILSVQSVAYCVSTQISVNLLVTRFPVRLLAVLAAVVNVVATLVFVAAPVHPVFFVTTIVKLTAHGISMIPTITLVGFYFRRRRGLATTLGAMGTSFSSIVMAPLTRYLRQEYGMRGCYLLIAAFEMHAIVASLLLRPRPTATNKMERASREKAVPRKMKEAKTNAEPRERNSEDEQFELKETLLKNRHSHGLYELERSLNGETSVLEKGDHRGSNVSVDFETTVYRSQSLTMVTGSNDDSNTLGDKSKGANKYYQTICGCVQSIVDLSLLSNFLCITLLLSYTLTATGLYTNIYLPSYATETLNISQTRAAILLAVVGAVDLVSRLVFGFLADLRILRPNLIIAATSLCLGFVTQFAPLIKRFETLVFFAVIHGMFYGIGTSLNSALIVDVLGLDNMAKVLALGSLTMSVAFSIQHPVLGALIESTGGFTATFHYVGVAYILAACLLVLEPVIRRVQERRNGKTEKYRVTEREELKEKGVV